ncbi:RIMS-binding protein 2 isoform X4 [Plodia interpunctella]|uniref:RIMS-binding protein 2 isoform X4 n=1 Tax=Plodia interpunctella TaxID=58824 RepID=UPI002367DACE|nr:RIMS-binding protein 2 isoform X4 [Plodia interpunctella]
MSGYGVTAGGMSGGGDTDTLSRRLREAERARADAERAHADALAQLRNAQRSPLDAHNVEQLQSRARELEKKAALETVRCEELQLELSAAMRARGASSGGGWSSAPAQPASEIERIMAKIEQDNRILAELEHTRSTTHGMQSSGSNQALGEFHSPNPSPLPHSYTSTTGHVAICQSNTMPTLSSLHAASQLSAPNSNSVGYSMSAHNPTSFSNPIPAYSTNTYLANPHQVTFTNPVTAPMVNNIGQISSTLAGLQSNLQNITGNMSAMSLGSALTGPTLTGTIAGSGLTSCLNNVQTSLSGGLTSTLGGIQSSLTGLTNPLGNLTGGTQLSALNTSLTGTNVYGTTGTYTNPLLSSGLGTNTMNIKLKPLDEIDLGLGRFGTTTTGTGRVATPVTPHQAGWNLGLDSQYGPDRLGGIDTGFSHDRNQRALSRIMPNSGLDMDVRNTHYMNGGAPTEGQVDMLDIPGKGRCCVYIARFSYDPPEIESAEGELSICTGDYLLVWGPPDPNASMLDAELLDGRRGLVPANFVQRLVGDDLLEFHQAVVATLRDVDESATTAVSDLSLSRDVARLSEVADISEGPEDDDNAELFFSSLVPAPRQLTLERQLNKSVLIGWTAPEGVQQANIESYHVYVDGVLKTTVKASERTRALVEGVDSNRPHRISVRSVTVTRRTSRDAACTMVIGRDTANMGPTCVRASGVTCSQAIISWLPANSNHQHVVCVNNVEVRTVKPGVYRHTITGLSPSTQYRVTVRAKHLRAGPPSGIPIEEAPGAYTDFRTLPKGLPDPPNEIMVEAGPQDGTLLVTWQPVARPPASGPVTGYAVYADGKKVTDVDSPTGDHALIDIGKLIGLNPKCVTVRTKSRDSQSSDSAPTPIPPAVLRGVASRMPRGPHPPNQPVPPGYRMPQRPQPYQHQQQVIEHDENLSDKEIFPTGNRHDQHAAQQSGIPAIEITKEGAAELGSEDEEASRRRTQQQPSQPAQASQQPSGAQYQSTQAYHGTQQPPYQQAGQFPSNQQTPYSGQPQPYQNPPPRNHHERGRPPNPHQQQQGQQAGMQYGPRGVPPAGPRGPQPAQMRHHQPQGLQQSKRSRYFIALFDYDPATMSPNPESCDEELPFSEGDTIKVWGDKDADGFYWGECRGRRGYVPHNMVAELSEQEAAQAAPKPRDRWTDAYATQPVRRMVALYDYDPQELSPNVDADAELSFQTGQIIHVYGEMDDDGFYMAEIDGVRGLVPSNFLTDANDQYAVPGQTSQGGAGGVRGVGAAGGVGPGAVGGAGAGRGRGAASAPGPGARGPPPPPRDNVAPAPRNHHRKADACPLPPSQLDHNTCASNPEQANSQARARGVGNVQATSTIARTSAGNAGTPTVQSPGTGGGAGNVGGMANINMGGMSNMNSMGAMNNMGGMGNLGGTGSAGTPMGSAGSGGVVAGVGGQVTGATSNVSPARRAGPAVVPAPTAQPLPPAQVPPTSQPNLMQKFSEMTAPGGDILSKGKELIFMKFGLGGK